VIRAVNVSLRKVRLTDFYCIAGWRNANAEFFPEQRKFTELNQYAWFTDVYAHDPADHYYMVLETTDGDYPVGTIAFNSKTYEIGRVLLGDKQFERRGIMSEALAQLIEAFPVGRYWLRVKEGNDAAVRFYEKNGFYGVKTVDGMLRMESA
jgi:RimJ/RimL family protein N-acetyltransferase